MLGTGPLSFSWATHRPVPAPAHFVFAVAQYGRHAPYKQMRPALQSLVPPHGFPIVVDPAAMHDAAPVCSLVTSQVSFVAHPHCGASPQRLFGGAVTHDAGGGAASPLLASAPFVTFEPASLSGGVDRRVGCTISSSLVDGSLAAAHASSVSAMDTTTKPARTFTLFSVAAGGALQPYS